MTQCIIYCRVSTKDQVDEGVSLETQQIFCKNYAQNSGYKINKVFVERGESAKTTDRTQLQEMLKYLSSNKNPIKAIIVYRLDRLSRNVSDMFELIKIFSVHGIILKSATENIDETPTGKFLRTMFSGLAQLDNEQKAERTLVNMKQALKNGRWCWQAPMGYKFIKDETKKPLLIPSEDSVYIVEAFALIETGIYKQSDVIDILKRKGFQRANKTLMSRILTNYLYAGLIVHDWFPGEIIKAIHKPLITEETFYKVQAILFGRQPQITPKERNNPDFPLRNFVQCPLCGKKITGSWSTGRNKKYPYYHCNAIGCGFSIDRDELNNIFYLYVKTLQPNTELFDLFHEIIIDVWNKKQADKLKEQVYLEKALKATKQKQERLLELLINKAIDEETYKEKIEEVKNELVVNQLELNEANIDLNEIESCINYCKHFILNIADLWLNSGLEMRQRFQQLLFPQGISYQKNQTFGTTKISLLFNTFQGSNMDELRLVAPEGIEPSSPT